MKNIKLYKFSELSEKAKEIAIENFIEQWELRGISITKIIKKLKTREENLGEEFLESGDLFE